MDSGLGKINNPSNFTVLVGALKLSDPGPHSIIASVKRIILNPTYEGDSRIGDIALIQLEQRLPLAQRISPICIPNANINLFPGQKCWVTGWGNIRSKGGIAFFATPPSSEGPVAMPLLLPPISCSTTLLLHHHCRCCLLLHRCRHHPGVPRWANKHPGELRWTGSRGKNVSCLASFAKWT
ncbi:serine protease 27-like [Crotalus adamanteus]|uniref:Serine protease 27-like n=1 Tax=Crotalus adamanteus TaxID=8729 RepID=A0AAW1B070_CROAD